MSKPPSAATRPPEKTESARGPRKPSTLSAKVFQEFFGDSLKDVLNLSEWRAGFDLPKEYQRIEQEVAEAVNVETDFQKQVRERMFPALSQLTEQGIPKAGLYHMTVQEVQAIQQRLLFPGQVECVDGSCQVHDTLPLRIYSLGVSLVSYKGDSGTWGMKLFRRDLRQKNDGVIDMALEMLKNRSSRSALNHESPRDTLSNFAQRALMTYAERAVLVQHAKAPWRMGHGNPAAFELLVGGGCADLTISGIRLLIDLIHNHQKFVFVTSEPAEVALLSLGQALHPLEFIICGSLEDKLHQFVEKAELGSEVTVDDTWDGMPLTPHKWLLRFKEEVASKVVYGVYRATRLAPAQLFYAHVDWAEEAAMIALADSVLQEQRGFPLLIDLADQTCRSVYGGGGLREIADSAYVKVGQPFRYHSERDTRDQRDM